MKISITGTTGFLGSKIFERLNVSKKNYTLQSINLRNINFSNDIDIKKEIESCLDSDFIFNCAASLNPKKYSDFYINEKIPSIFENLIKEKSSKATFIHFSTINTIIRMRKDRYTLSKIKGEKSLNKNSSIIIRLPFLIEKENNSFKNSGNLKEFFKYLKKKYLPIYPMISPGHIYQPVDIDKLLDFLEKVILEDKKNEVYNIVGKYKKCLWELFEEVAKIENKKIIKINLNFVKKILPEIVKKQLRKRTGVLQQILSIDHSDFSERKIIL
tara:strand:+ start:1490 stop:2302 length:813 start_codon:yes stop_codon:yes gene_type:complete